MKGWWWSRFVHAFAIRNGAQGPRRRETPRRLENTSFNDMRAHVLFLGLFGWCADMLGQQTFVSILESTMAYQGNLAELNSHNYHVALSLYPGVTLLNPNGDFVHSKCFYGDSVLTLGAIQKFTDNEFYFVTSYRKDSCSSTTRFTHPAIGRMDSLGNITQFRHYKLYTTICDNSPGNLNITSNKGIVVWGREERFYAFQVDSIGAPIWAKRFSEEGSFRFIKELPSGDLLAGFDLPTAGASVARLDADGNIIWCKSYMRPLGLMHDAIVESDSSFIITGFTSTTNAKLFMMELDGDGAVQWCRGYGSGAYEWYTPQWSQLERTIDGNYAVLATLGQGGFFFRPFLMKTDLNGDTLWSRSTGADGYIYHTRDLLVASDGGYVFSGVVWGNLPDMNTGLPYIFKADSLGQFSCLSRNHPVELYDLFPTDSSFILTSTDGATMHQAFVSDTTFAPLSVYDACEVANAFRPYPDYKRERMRVRPNPNTGRFTVQFTDPLLAESYYSVYDAMGKLLYQRPLPKGRQTEEVDLSRFGAGTYVIRFTDKEGSCHERVVVE